MSKFWQIFAWGTLIIAFMLMVLISYWQFYPYTPFTLKSPIITTENSYVAGKELKYKLSYCKSDDQIVTVSRGFIDGVIYSMPDVTASNPEGCRETEIQITVPNIPAGKYQLRITYSYKVNPIRSVSITCLTNNFQITEKEERR
jgi:hypothetical protein